MVDINATFVLQVVHFLIAWWLLERFFFRVVVAVIHTETEEVQGLVDLVERERTDLHRAYDLKVERWQQYRQRYKSKTPAVEMHPALSYSAVLCPVTFEIDAKQKQKMVKEATDFFVKKALNHDA